MSGFRASSFFRSTSQKTLQDKTPPGRKENVILSSEELNKIFDAFNSISSNLKSHLQELHSIKESQNEVIAEVKNLRDENKVLQESLVHLNDLNMEYDSKIPPEISSEVHLLHGGLSDDDKYNPEESILSAHNMSVRRELEEQMSGKGFPLKLVKRAVARYYETKRKLFLQSLPENKEKASVQKEDNKMRSRRKRLYNARLKAAEGKDKEDMKSLSYDYVSDEENGCDSNRGRWVVRPPAWRSDEASSLMERLQGKLTNARDDDVRARVPRVEGPPSEREQPRAPVSWAVQASQQSSHTPLQRSSHIPSPHSSQQSSHTSSIRSSQQSSHTPSPRSSHTPLPRSSHTPTPRSSHTPTPRSSHTPTPRSSHTPLQHSSHTPSPRSSHTPTPRSSHTPTPRSSHTPLPPLHRSSHTCTSPQSHQMASDEEYDVHDPLPLSPSCDDPMDTMIPIQTTPQGKKTNLKRKKRTQKVKKVSRLLIRKDNSEDE